jgi:hypothetical protein
MQTLCRKAVDLFEGMVEKEMAASKRERSDAIRHVVANNPDVHQAYVKAANILRDTADVPTYKQK